VATRDREPRSNAVSPPLPGASRSAIDRTAVAPFQIATRSRERIHVLQLTFGMGIGGMERVIMDLCRYVDPERFRFSICCLNVRGPLADQMEAEGVPVYFCRNQSRLAKYLRGVELAGLMSKLKVQVLHTHHLPAFIDGTIGGRLTGVPVTLNTDHSKLYPISKPWALLERAASMMADEVVAVSKHTRNDLIHQQKISPNRISVIYNGINIRLTADTPVTELRRELAIPIGDKIIGTVSRLEDQKGLDLLLNAAPHVLRTRPNTWFVIVGGGSKEQQLKDLAASLGIAHRTRFTGWRRDAVDLVQTFDCCALSSTFEGMPMSLLEAMALAKPIVATAVGGVPEFVRDGENGILVDSRDPSLFADAVLRVISQDDEARRMGENGRRRYQKRFTAEAMARDYAALYEKHLERKGIPIR